MAQYFDPSQQQQFAPAPQQQQGVASNQQQQQFVQPQQQDQFAQQPGAQQQQQFSQQQAAQVQETAAPTPDLVAPPAPTSARFTWNAYPNGPVPSKVPAGQNGPHGPDFSKMIVPLAAIYTPMSDSDHVPSVSATPVGGGVGGLFQCRTCEAYLNLHSPVDLRAQFWSCNCCLTRNTLPVGFNPQGAASLSYPSVDYELPAPVAAGGAVAGGGEEESPPPLFLYVIDTCISNEELDALKAGLIRSLEYLPANALVGCISFGRSVTVWEIGFGELSKCYMVRGHREYSQEDLLRMLGVSAQNPVVGRFLMPVADAEFTLTSILEELTPDPFPVPNGRRPERATGTALQIGMSIAEFARKQDIGGNERTFCGGKVMLYTGGPCTRGSGAVATLDRGDIIRFHRDLMEGNAPLYDPAVDFYRGITARLSNNRCCLDTVVACFDQVGILELRSAVNETGGTFICCDSFEHPMFRESLHRHFQRCDLTVTEGKAPKAGFAGRVSVHTSQDTLVCGAIGPVCQLGGGDDSSSSTYSSPTSGSVTAAAAANAASAGVTALLGGGGGGPKSKDQERRGKSNVDIGVPGTKWQCSQLDSSTAITVIFDTEAGGNETPSNASGPKRFIQFVTTYMSSTGKEHVRVTSFAQPIGSVDPAHPTQQNAFDQECAACVVAKMAVSNLDMHVNRWNTMKRWLDRLLVKFVKKFGNYRINDPESLRLAPCYSFFPSFLYNLRRSEYFMYLNISPDETAFKRHFLLRERCDNVLIMMQPTLSQYSMDKPYATAVVLDASSITPDTILLMDAFFNIHIMWGQMINEWKNQNYQDLPEYAHFKAMLEAPEADLQQLLAKRFPYPRYSRVDVNGSEARHVKTRVNPSSTHTSGGQQQQPGGRGGAQQDEKTTIYTDDASIARFMQTLKQAVVTPEEK